MGFSRYAYSGGIRTKKWFGYVVLAFSALNVIFLGGKRRAFGIFVAALHSGEFNTTSLPELNWIGDSYAAVGYMSTAASTALILRMNRRYRLSQMMGSLLILSACITSSLVPSAHWLFVTHTLLHGLGSSLILSTVGLIVNDYFDKSHPRHILATTLVSGGSVASIVFVQMYAMLITQFGWRRAFIILGFIYFVVNTSACLVFVKSVKQRHNRNHGRVSLEDNDDLNNDENGGDAANDGDKEPDKKQFSIRDYLSVQKHSIYKKSPRCLLGLWLFDRIMTSIVTYGMLLNLADYMKRHQDSLNKSTLLTLLFAAGEAVTYLIGAIITGFTRNWLHNRLRYILLVSTFIMSGCLILWEFIQKGSNRHNQQMVNLSHLLSLLSGLCLGPSITFLFPAGEELTGLPGHMAYPFSLFGMGLGMAMSPIFTALIAQLFDYRWYFLVQGILIFLKFLCLCFSCYLIHTNQTHPISQRRHLQSKLSSSTDRAKSKSLNPYSGNGHVSATWKHIPSSDDKVHLLNADIDDEDDYNDGGPDEKIDAIDDIEEVYINSSNKSTLALE